MSTNLKNLEKALKETYMPLINNMVGTETSAFLTKIKKEKLESDKVVSAAPIGLLGSFGMSSEGVNTPGSGNRIWERFTATAKDMYSNLEISNKSILLTGEKGSMANGIKDLMKAAYEEIAFNTERQLFGDGTGKLATIATVSGNTIVVDSTAIIREGMTVDIVKKGASTVAEANKQKRIIAIDHETNTVHLDDAGTAAGEDYITVQNSLNRELTGLGAVFNDNIATIYGVSKAENPILKPLRDTTSNITDEFIRHNLMKAKRQRGADIDMLLCGDEMFAQYSSYLDEKREKARTMDLEGGFKAISFLLDNKEIAVLSNQFVPTNKMWCVDTKEILLKQTEWGFADTNTGGIFTLIPDKSVYRALMANYAEIIVKRPGSCVELTYNNA